MYITAHSTLLNAYKVQHYRYWVLWRCPSIRFLDYQKVRDVERRRAEELFGTQEEPSQLATEVSIFSSQLKIGMRPNADAFRR